MGMGIKIPWVGGRYTIDRAVKIPWVGGSLYHRQGGQNIMGRGQNTMGRESKFHE